MMKTFAPLKKTRFSGLSAVQQAIYSGKLGRFAPVTDA